MMKAESRRSLKEWAGWSRLARASYLSMLAAWACGYLGKLCWVFELASHFKLQYLLASLVFAPLFASIGLRRWALLALACALVNGLHVAHFYVPSSGRADSGRPAGRLVRVLHSNVHIENHNHDALLKLICAENPDLIIVQEVTPEWAAALETIRDRYPEGIIIPAETAGGIGVLSRLPLLSAEDAGIEKYNGPSLDVRLRVGDRTLQILTSHTPPPISRALLEARNQHFAEIAEHLRRMPAPKILVGDLNSTVWSPYFAETIGRTGLLDAREGFGLFPTWPTWLPVTAIPIDQCFVSPDVEIVNLKAGPHIGSDHLPLIIDLRLR